MSYTVKALKHTLVYELTLEKVHRPIEFNQKALLKSCIDLNTELRSKAKKGSETEFFWLMNNYVFGKTMENVRNHRESNL